MGGGCLGGSGRHGRVNHGFGNPKSPRRIQGYVFTIHVTLDVDRSRDEH